MSDTGAGYVMPKATLKEKIDGLFWLFIAIPLYGIFLLIKFLITYPFKKKAWNLLKNKH